MPAFTKWERESYFNRTRDIMHVTLDEDEVEFIANLLMAHAFEDAARPEWFALLEMFDERKILYDNVQRT